MQPLALLLLLGAGLLLWGSAMDARARARDAAKRACRQAAVSFIDELVLKRLRFGRNRRGRFGLIRIYAFEYYTSGDLRYAGEVEMAGRTVTAIRMSALPDI